jgi:hypothetical protein
MFSDCTYEAYFRFSTDPNKMSRFYTIIGCHTFIPRIYSCRDLKRVGLLRIYLILPILSHPLPLLPFLLLNILMLLKLILLDPVEVHVVVVEATTVGLAPESVVAIAAASIVV